MCEIKMCMIQAMILFFGLVIFAVIDFVEHKISVKGLWIFGGILLLCKMVEYIEKHIKETEKLTIGSAWTEFWTVGIGIGVGVLFLLISKVTNQKIGYGDSWLILILGTVVGGFYLIEILAGAFFLLALTGIFLLVAKKGKEISGARGNGFRYQPTLPFVPFLVIGYVLMFLSERGS